MRSNKLIQFYLTNMCNSHCKTCQIWTNANVEELDIEVVKQIINDFPDADYVFGGGETTLYSHLDELLDFCKINNINYTLLTNCVDYDKVINIINNHHVNNVTISCDGIDHDKIRGVEGNFKNIVRFIFEDSVEHLKLSYTLSKFNEQNFTTDMKLFKLLGFDKIYFCLATSFVGTNASNLLNVDVNRILEHEDMLFDKDANFIKALLNNSKHECDSRNDVWTIASNGDVLMCQHRNDVLGNVYQSSLKDIYHNRVFEKCPLDESCHLLCQRRYDNYEN